MKILGIRFVIAVFCCLVMAPFYFAQAETEIKVIALFNGKAMLSIDGKAARIIEQGMALHGVRLVKASTEEATIEVEGKQRTISLSSGTLLTDSLGAKPPAGSQNSVQLWSDASGFFRVNGQINGHRARFLVDTGANLVVLSSRDADRMGVEYRSAAKGLSMTASGTAPIYILNADSISIESIELKNIKTGVVEGDFPLIPLLGMSFLEKVDMTRRGSQMILTKRF